MKTILLYGPGEVGKRTENLRIKKQFLPEDITTVDLKQGSLDSLQNAVRSVQLFSTNKRLVIGENVSDKFDLTLFTFREESLTLLLLANLLRSDATLLQSAKKIKAQVFNFEGEKEVLAFPFLDALIEKKKSAFVELEKLLDGYGGMYILSMIFYLLRRNILPLPSSPFAQNKILQQKKKHTHKDWIRFYQLTLETEFKIKSGLIGEKLGLTNLVNKFTS